MKRGSNFENDNRKNLSLEMAEKLIYLGLQVTLIQMGPQVMNPMDPEMARYVENHLEKHGVHLILDDGAAGFQRARLIFSALPASQVTGTSEGKELCLRPSACGLQLH